MREVLVIFAVVVLTLLLLRAVNLI